MARKTQAKTSSRKKKPGKSRVRKAGKKVPKKKSPPEKQSSPGWLVLEMRSRKNEDEQYYGLFYKSPGRSMQNLENDMKRLVQTEKNISFDPTEYVVDAAEHFSLLI